MNFLVGLIPNEDGGDTPSSTALRQLVLHLTPEIRKTIATIIEAMESSRLAATEDTEGVLECLAWCRRVNATVYFSSRGSVVISRGHGTVWEYEARTFVEAVRAAQLDLARLADEEDVAAEIGVAPIVRPRQLPDHIEVFGRKFTCNICGDQTAVTDGDLHAPDAIEAPLPHLGLVRMLHIYVNEHPTAPHSKPATTQVLQFRVAAIDAVTSGDPLAGLCPIRMKADVADP